MGITDADIIAAQEASGHSIYGGSSLPRIVSCPASVGVQLAAGPKAASPYAIKGTELHELAEKAQNSTQPREWIFQQDIDLDDTTYLLDALEYVQKIFEKHEGEVTVRTEVEGNLGSYGMEECWGTADVIIESTKRIDVIDYKFGHGVAVFAKKNYQLVSYLGMVVPYEETPNRERKMYIHINQPTKNIFDEWEVTWDDLYRMLLGDVYDAMQNSRVDNPKFGPSESACRFCGGNMGCKERHAFLQDQAALIKQMAMNPSAVPNEQWAVFLTASSSLRTAISQVEKHAMSELMKGNEFPGFKLVAGKANRAFKDKAIGEKYIKSTLGSKAFKTADLVTLAQAEKLHPKLKKDDKWLAMVHKPGGKAKLVSEDHSGEALTFGLTSVFDQIAKGTV